LYLYDPDLKQVVISQLKNLGGVSPAMLLVNREIENLFEISVIQDRKGINWFKAVPQEPEKANFKEVFINFVQKKLKGMRVIDSFDNITEIEFIKVSRNIIINEAIFLFNTPEDTDVIRN
jgi:outer membrane lipoprotein carrier protein